MLPSARSASLRGLGLCAAVLWTLPLAGCLQDENSSRTAIDLYFDDDAAAAAAADAAADVTATDVGVTDTDVADALPADAVDLGEHDADSAITVADAEPDAADTEDAADTAPALPDAVVGADADAVAAPDAPLAPDAEPAADAAPDATLVPDAVADSGGADAAVDAKDAGDAPADAVVADAVAADAGAETSLPDTQPDVADTADAGPPDAAPEDVPAADIPPGGCKSPNDCPIPAAPCMVADCTPEFQCGFKNRPDYSPCEDGNPCTAGDLCQSGACLSGLLPACDDGKPCTDDSCNVVTGCHFEPNTLPCDLAKPCSLPSDCTTTSCSNGFCAPDNMAAIPAGTFWMGCNPVKDTQCFPDESPQHKVTLNAYFIDRSEVTVAEYKICVDAGVCTEPKGSAFSAFCNWSVAGKDAYPVNCITWTQSQQYCKWRGLGFDLPSEAQWELAARGTCELNGSAAADGLCKAAMRTYPWGEAAPSCLLSVTCDSTTPCSPCATAAVGSKPAGDSPFGVHDMAGNVWEWVRDGFGPYTAGNQTNPQGVSGATSRVLRGGGFDIDAAHNRSSYRSGESPSTFKAILGLRCARPFP